MKKREGEPWMDAAEYGRSLKGIGINLMVPSVESAMEFQREVIGATILYADADFAALEGYGSAWCLHSDHTYSDHPLNGSLQETAVRGIGAEIRVHGCDPDAAEAKARTLGYTVLAGAMDKPHGVCEAYIIDADGYLWVPDVPLAAE